MLPLQRLLPGLWVAAVDTTLVTGDDPRYEVRVTPGPVDRDPRRRRCCAASVRGTRGHEYMCKVLMSKDQECAAVQYLVRFFLLENSISISWYELVNNTII